MEYTPPRPREKSWCRATGGRAGTLAQLVSAVVIATALTGCSHAPREEPISPLGAGAGEPTFPPGSTGTGTPDERAGADPHRGDDPSAASVTATPGEPEGPREELEDLLGRYDAALSALHADPTAAGDDDHPLTREWLEVVVVGSQLDREVRGRILAGALDDSLAVVAGPEGVSYSNTATEVHVGGDGSLEWTNCGYAPGLGVDLHSGAVLDTNRTHTSGRGRAVRDPGGRLVVSELWDDRTRLLGPDEPNPCESAEPTGAPR